MLNPELKKRIVNTISEYEKKCGDLQQEIEVLKSSIGKLCAIPISTDSRVVKTVDAIKNVATNKSDVSHIQENIDHLASVMTLLQEKKQNNHHQMQSFIAHATSLLKDIELSPQEKKSYVEMEALLNAPNEEQMVFEHFITLLSQCINSLTKQLAHYKEQAQQKTEGKGQPLQTVNPQVNDSLLQLLNHLTIPQELNFKSKEVKSGLERPLDISDLVSAVDNLTELVIEAFNLEQNRFKGFLKEVTNQLIDFESYLKLSVDNSHERQHDTLALESGLEENMAEIKNHIDSSKTIEELSAKVGKNLETMGARLKSFKANELERAVAYEEQLSTLQDKLQSSEKNIEEMKNLLAFQKFRVNHDVLTDLPNRASFDEHIAESFHRYERGFGALTLAVADIDWFKKINDTYGHLAGDKVLKKIAQIFRNSVRSVDFVARYGGEEFVFIFERTDLDEAVFVIEKLRHTIEECQFSYKDNKVDVTVSFGVTAAEAGDDIEKLFQRADDKLYKAKNNGRNRVEH